MSVLDLDNVDAIRKPTPQLDRTWLIGLALIAAVGFASGFLNQLYGQLNLQPPAEEAAPAIAAVRPLPLDPIVQPAMQVATTVEPAAVAPPKLDVPDPVAAPPQPAAPANAVAVDAASATANEPPVQTLPEPVPELEEPPSD